ncbi:hypothetical protein [Amycolatopsis thermoflava]|uniref:hypothetical protein n=1 Tax=Amycolatopsis thermoflava TaxID=84480 RepID=UPI00041BBF35|nr:hypothetical protein [Amycolatopsis thermoflava]
MTTTEPKTTRRVPPPPIEHRAPDCSICGEETHWDDGGFGCEDCGAWWPEEAVGREEPGEWNDEDERQCRWVIQPYADHPVHERLRPFTYRCLKAEDHDQSSDDGIRWHVGQRVDEPEPDTYSWLPGERHLAPRAKTWQVEASEPEPEPDDVDEAPGLVPAVVTVELPPFTEEA